jgi:hypothetical protein
MDEVGEGTMKREEGKNEKRKKQHSEVKKMTSEIKNSVTTNKQKKNLFLNLKCRFLFCS